MEPLDGEAGPDQPLTRRAALLTRRRPRNQPAPLATEQPRKVLCRNPTDPPTAGLQDQPAGARAPHRAPAALYRHPAPP